MSSVFATAQLAAADVPAASEPDWLVAARSANRAAFVAGDLPAAREERWKYTSLRALSQRALATRDPAGRTHAIAAAALALPGVDGLRVVFVNGQLRADLSTLSDAPQGLSLLPLSNAAGDGDERTRGALARTFAAGDEAFARLTAALAREGLLLRVAAGQHIASPLHVVFANTTAAADVGWHARLLVQLGEGATLTVIEHHLDAGVAASAGDAIAGVRAHVGHVLSDFHLGPRSQLRHLRLQVLGEQATLIARTDAHLGEGAALQGWSLDLGAQLARHELRIALAGSGAVATTRGVFMLRGRQHVDTQLDLVHAARDTRCDLAMRGVADQRSRGVFQGRIVVAPGADGADARLENKNLLLSPHAEIDTKPVLEILADEVKASHGATVGQLDEQALFYLRSRGIPAEQARTLLTFAFCRSMLDAVPIAGLREYLASLLLARLPQQGVAA